MKYFYVITPVGSDPGYAAKRRVLAEIALATGCECFMPLERRRPGTIGVVSSDLLHAMLVIADLSLERPSCYFELGVARAVGVPVFILAKAGTTIHQTGELGGVHWYADLTQFRRLVTHVIEEALVRPDSADSDSVMEVASHR